MITMLSEISQAQEVKHHIRGPVVTYKKGALKMKVVREIEKR